MFSQKGFEHIASKPVLVQGRARVYVQGIQLKNYFSKWLFRKHTALLHFVVPVISQPAQRLPAGMT